MWTDADTMHTHADYLQKCGQMRTNMGTDVPSMGLQKKLLLLVVGHILCNHNGSTNFCSVVGLHLDR